VRRRGDLQIRSVTLKQTVPQFQTCAFSSRTSMLQGSFWTRPLPLEDSPQGLLVVVRIGNLAASCGDTAEMSSGTQHAVLQTRTERGRQKNSPSRLCRDLTGASSLPLRDLQGHFTPRLEFQVNPDSVSALSLNPSTCPSPLVPNAFVSKTSLLLSPSPKRGVSS